MIRASSSTVAGFQSGNGSGRVVRRQVEHHHRRVGVELVPAALEEGASSVSLSGTQTVHASTSANSSSSSSYTRLDVAAARVDHAVDDRAVRNVRRDQRADAVAVNPARITTPIAPNAERIVAQHPIDGLHGAEPIRRRAPQRVVCVLALLPLDLARRTRPVNGTALPSPRMSTPPRTPAPADLEPRRHLLLRLEAAHQLPPTTSASACPAATGRSARARRARSSSVVEALVLDLPADAGGQLVARHRL